MSSSLSSSRDVSQSSSTSAGGQKPNPMYWGLTLLIVVLDVITKALAVQHLAPRHVPHPFIGEYVRFTLAYNPGAAFGFNLGPASRWIFATLSVVIVVVLFRSTRELVTKTKLAAFGVPIVIGGAIGNLLDRVRFREGVVDFIDVGVGSVRFWTFNVADSAVTVGAVLLVLALWRHDLTTSQS